MSIKYYIHKWIGRIWDSPIIPKGKTIGYSFVKSVRHDVESGKNTRIRVPYYLNHVLLGDYSYIANNSSINKCTIGKFCSIGPNFCCGLGSHPINGISTSPMFYSTGKQNGISLCEETSYEETKPTFIGNDVFIGANVTLLDGVSISDGAVVGTGAVVTKNVPPYAVVAGVPATVIKYRFDEKTIERLLKSRWWDNPDENKLRRIAQNFWDVDVFLEQE